MKRSACSISPLSRIRPSLSASSLPPRSANWAKISPCVALPVSRLVTLARLLPLPSRHPKLKRSKSAQVRRNLTMQLKTRCQASGFFIPRAQTAFATAACDKIQPKESNPEPKDYPLTTAFKRILLKISGEALAATQGFGVDVTRIHEIAGEIR